MNHYTYIIQHDDMAYIGVRSCECNPSEDNYWGSSRFLPKDISDKGIKKIIGIHTTREEATQREVDLHDLFDVAINPKFYNQAKQASTGFDRSGTTLTDEHRAKLSKARIGVTPSNIDATIYNWHHKDKGNLKATRYDLYNANGYCPSQTSKVIRGILKSVGGWSIIKG